MTIILQHRRGSTAESNALTGAEGELFIDLDKNTVVVHDGVVQGGYPLPTFSNIANNVTDQFARNTANSATNLAQSAYNYANTIVSDTQIDPYARSTANTASNNIIILQGVNATQNTNITTATNLAQGAYNNSNTKFSASGGQITGNVTIVGDLNVTNNTVVTKAIEANNAIFDGTLYSGLAARSSVVLPHLVAQFASNSATYIQTNSQNINPEGSADYVVTADNGTDTDFYIDMGLHGSQAYDGVITPYDGYLYVQGSTIGQAGGNLIIGTTSSYPGLETRFIAGGYQYQNNIIMRIGTYGANVIGNLTVTNQVISPTTNAINSFAQSAYNAANTNATNITIIQGVNTTQNTNITTATNLAQSAFNAANSASQTIPQNAQSSTYNLQASDAGKHIYSTSSTAQTINLPNNGSVSWTIGSTIMLIIQGTGTMNVVPATGVTMYLANNSTAKAFANVNSYGMATLFNVGANTWFINGAGVS